MRPSRPATLSMEPRSEPMARPTSRPRINVEAPTATPAHIKTLQSLQRLFRGLLPSDHAFVDCFCRHSTLVARGAEAFRRLLTTDAPDPNAFAEIDRLEAEADAITRETVRAI